MNRHKPAFLTIIVAVGVIASLAIQHHAELRRRERRELAQQQADNLARLSAENEQLSNLIARVKGSPALSPGQFKELLGLRNEVGRLRRTGSDRRQLEASNTQLSAAVATAGQRLAEARAAPNYWSKDKLAYAGYADPESAMKSLLAVMNSGDPGSWRARCTPEALAGLDNESARHGLSEAQQDAKIKSMAAMLMSASAGFHILDQTMTAPDKAVIDLSFDGEGAHRKFVLRKVANEWKFDQLLLDGQQYPDSQ
jgi:hypothetical protein